MIEALVALVLAFTPPEDAPRRSPAMVQKVAPSGALDLDRGPGYKLAGVTGLALAKARPFLDKFVVGRPAHVEFEPDGKSLHLFVSADCAELEAFERGRSDRAAGGCVKSVYVNRYLLDKKFAKPAPKGVKHRREKLFGEAPKKKR